MAISKKMKKILADFYALYDLYLKARENGSRKSAMYYGEKFMEYCFIFQKELKLSDEYMTEWKKTFEVYKANVRKEQLLEEELTAIRAQKEILYKEYYDLVLADDTNGLIKWN